MARNFSETILPTDFPELSMLVWNRNPAHPIAAVDVFALYERNWRFVDQDRLTQEEAMLIRDLTDMFGHGHLLA